MPISPKEKSYLKNKHKGGHNNSKGNVYENFYATYCMALFMSSHTDRLDNVRFTSQVKDCFVDDLLIEDTGKTYRTYHQIKDVQSLSWKTKYLLYDFKRQKDISTEKKENFELKLVYSNPVATVTPIPKEITSCTSAHYFPAEKSLNSLLLSHSPFKNAIQNITASGKATDDELLGIAEALLGVWAGSEQQDLSLQVVSDAVNTISNEYINIKTSPTVNLSEQCQLLLQRFRLNFHTCGSNLHWSTADGHLSGQIKWTPEMEKKLEAAQPSDFWDLIVLLS